MPRIWDTFLFRDELDMLQLRLEELSDIAYKHVIVESYCDFHGRPKPLHYAENKARFSQWQHKIVHIVIAFPENLPFNPFVTEHKQRDCARSYLEDHALPDDIVLLCDVDEIPSREALNWRGGAAVALKMRTTHSAVDWLYPQPEYASVICRMSFIRGNSLGEVRDGRYGYPVIENGGWHLSWLGGVEKQREKLSVTFHLELPQSELDAINGGRAYTHGEHYGGSQKMMPVEVDNTWPDYVYTRRCPPQWFRPRKEST